MFQDTDFSAGLDEGDSFDQVLQNLGLVFGFDEWVGLVKTQMIHRRKCKSDLGYLIKPTWVLLN